MCAALTALAAAALAAHPAAGRAAAAAGSVEAHHTHFVRNLQSLFTSTLARVPADRCQQEPWTGQEAENKCATICILTGCGPRRPRVLRARATGDFQTAICRPSTSPGTVPWDCDDGTPPRLPSQSPTVH